MLEKIITLLYLSGDPLSFKKMSELLEVTEADILQQLPVVKEKLESIGLTLLITETEATVVTKSEHAQLVESFRKDELKGDLTPATLQVLTLVAYFGEITREQISYIRGVQSAQSIRTLLVRGLVSRSGENCRLTSDAFQMLGITKKEELPEYERLSLEFRKKLNEKEE